MSEEVCCKSLVCEHRDPMSLCDFLMTHHKVSLGEQSHAGASSPEINFPILEAFFLFSRFRVFAVLVLVFSWFLRFYGFCENPPLKQENGKTRKTRKLFFLRKRDTAKTMKPGKSEKHVFSCSRVFVVFLF